MIHSASVIKWTGSLKRRPFIRVAGDRAAAIALAALAGAILLPPMLRMPAMDSRTATVYAGFAILIFSLQSVQVHGGLQPPDRRRELAWLAVACTAYPLGAAGRTDLYSLQSLLFQAIGQGLDRSAGLAGSLPVIGLFFLFLSLCGIAGVLRVKNRELERLQRQAERTAELEEDNRSLATTIREKAEMLAQMSVLEERQRIAHEIHDVVGHTLTAAIVQLEATKRIAKQQDCVPWEKLDLLSGLVRQGLDDIRGAVRLIRSDEAHALTLDAAFRRLIRHTEETMEIAVDAEISLPPELQLGRVAEQVLYHALQEGLTNSIRHGRCAKARFSLRPSGGKLRFRLISDGKPYGSAVPGFGLSAMIERVRLLGGEVDIRSSADADGAPIGCELSIDLPLID
ncbi:sensor histidine kinase [Cohnella hongkongensis]|uniref:histidine kinase n=1 Tax=Cohnella hongkongensis TaxID=178337 RepID=A0ABV9F6W3_9BACL